MELSISDVEQIRLMFQEIVFFKDFIYLLIHQRESKSARAQAHKQAKGQADAEREAGSLPTKEPNAGPDPRTSGP